MANYYYGLMILNDSFNDPIDDEAVWSQIVNCYNSAIYDLPFSN